MFFDSPVHLCQLIKDGEKEQLEDILCQDYPPQHVPYKKVDVQEAMHLVLSQEHCDNEILQWLLDTNISPNVPCPMLNTSTLHKAVTAGNLEAVQVIILL